MKLEIIVKEQEPQRIDKYLISQNLEEIYSRSQVEKLIQGGLVLVNGEIEKKSYEVMPGDKISLEIIPQDKKVLKAEAIPLDVIYEDEYLVVVNKPSGMTVHPASGNSAGTLVNALLHRYGTQLSSGSEPERPGIVHRLDKDTTGLLLVARNDKIHSLLSNLFRDRNISKTYLAICCGIPVEETGRIETFVDRSSVNRKKMAVSKKGKWAITNYKIKEYFHYLSLLEVGLETGRTHQIRVHANMINCPVLGDSLYSSKKRELNLIPHVMGKRLKAVQAHHSIRQMLHAWKIEFVHPVSGELMKIEAPLPEDMANALKAIRKAEL